MSDITERIKGYASTMKRNPTKAEMFFNIRLKKTLKEHYPYIFPAPQQAFKHPQGWYIVDFYIGSLKLGFEIDGGYHWRDKQLDKDLKRDYFFDSKDIKLIHIPNSRVNNQRKRIGIEKGLKAIIEKRIGEIRNTSPLIYDKLRLRYRDFLITKLITVLKTRFLKQG